MGKSIKGTQTEKNILRAFEEECVSATKYRLFAEESKYQVVSDFFLEVASNEEEHAEVFLELLNALGRDKNNLKNAIALEGFVASIDYPNSAKVAREEGFDKVATKFEEIAVVEERHKKEFSNFLDKLEKDMLLKSAAKSKWLCLKCGHIHEGVEPPMECPICSHSKEHFKII